MKVEGTPFSKVLDKTKDTKRVTRMPNITIPVTQRAGIIPKAKPVPAVIKMEEMAINVGNLPLHGTRLLVSTAIRRSLGDSIIRQDTIPAALQPNPIAIHKHCLPWAQAFLNK